MATLSRSARSSQLSMRLAAVLAEYLGEREVSRLYADALHRTLRKAAAYGITNVRQLLPDPVNRFLEGLRQGGAASVSRANYRRMLLTLWKFAHERRYTNVAPGQVRTIRVVMPPPKAWDISTLQRLLDAAEADKRFVRPMYGDLRWSEVLPVWIAVGFETGLRLADLLSLRREAFRNGCVCVLAAKTGKVEIKRISEYAQRGVRRLLDKSPDGTVFRWAVTRRRAMVKWKEWLKEQNIEGTSKFLRRSSFTYTELKRPGTAHRFANHSDPSLVWMHYIDRTILGAPEGPDPLR